MTKINVLHISLQNHVQILKDTIDQNDETIESLVDILCYCCKNGNKIMLCGNGGSAADAQHVAAEFVNRFCVERGALPAIALTTNSSILTSIGNDSSFEYIFTRQIEAIGKKGDILVAFSTSGKSINILKALNVAKSMGIINIGFTGLDGRESLFPKCDYCFVVPSRDTPRIQEIHEFVWHVICEAIEQKLFSKKK